MKRACLAVSFLMVLLLSNPSVAAGRQDSCEDGVGWREVGESCHKTTNEVLKEYRKGPTAKYQYKLEVRCEVDLTKGECFEPLPCFAPPETSYYLVYRARTGVFPIEWVRYGQVCLSSPDELTREEISAASVARAFKRLTWPQADLVIQPPGGETLVNLETIFHTPDTAPVNQTVTLLGQRVEIEATPTSWTWHWAQPRDRASDASHQAHTSTDPGGAYPSRAITHTYTLADTTVHPSLDVTYTGRFRVNGDAWQTIPGNHTVTGTSQPLTVLQARPGLVQ